MSRNDKIRRVVSKLPETPRFRKGKIQRDSSGSIIYENHFRNLKRIDYMDISPESKKLLQSQYVDRVVMIDNMRRRRRTLKFIYRASISAIILAIITTMLWLRK